MTDLVEELKSIHRRKELASGLVLDGVDLGASQLEGLRAERLSLRGASLKSATLSDASLHLVNLSDADLQALAAPGLRARRSKFDHANLRAALLARANFEECSAEQAVFDEADLTRASLTGLTGGGASFRKCNARGSDFSGAKLEGACFAGAVLADADFADADLRGVDFSGADLSGAWLVRADLRGATLDGANFDRADLEGARWQAPSSPEQQAEQTLARIDHALGTIEEKLLRQAQGAASHGSSTLHASAASKLGRGVAEQALWVFERGEEHGPDSRFGLDHLELTPDLRFHYQNRQAGQLKREHRGSVTRETYESILSWLNEGGFPHVPDHPKPPGGNYVTIIRRSAQGEERAFMSGFEAVKFRGYERLVPKLAEWASVLRKPGATEAPEGFSYDRP